MIITITEKDLTKGEIEVLRQVLNHYFKTDLQIETTLKEIIFKDN